MASWQAFLMNGVLRVAMKRHGNGPLDLARVRKSTLNPPRRALHIPEGWRVDEVRGDGNLSFDVARRAMAAAIEPADVVLYLHGGGYFFGSPKTHRQIIIGMARAFEGPSYGLDYRLAPEHRFPAAVDDAVAAYRWVQAKHPKARLILAGDSAGGGLAVVTALAARDQGLPMPAAMVLFSPWTDWPRPGARSKPTPRVARCSRRRASARAPRFILAMPIRAIPGHRHCMRICDGLPPTLVFASLHEILLDDSTRLAEKARAAGVNVELILRDGVPHVWPIFLRLLPEGRQSLEEVARFARTLKRQAETVSA